MYVTSGWHTGIYIECMFGIRCFRERTTGYIIRTAVLRVNHIQIDAMIDQAYFMDLNPLFETKYNLIYNIEFLLDTFYNGMNPIGCTGHGTFGGIIHNECW